MVLYYYFELHSRFLVEIVKLLEIMTTNLQLRRMTTLLVDSVAVFVKSMLCFAPKLFFFNVPQI